MSTSQRRAVSIFLILLLSTCSLSVLAVFQLRQSTHGVFLSVIYQNGNSVHINDNSSLRQYNFTTEETNSSCRFLSDFQEEYTPEYPHQNLSFILLAEYSLGNGRYAINYSVAFEVIMPNTSRSWNYSNSESPGFATFGIQLANSNYTYTTVPREIDLIHISWTINLSSSIVPKDPFLCRLVVELRFVETSDGLSSTTSTTVTVALWVIGIVVLVELNRTRPSKSLSRKISG